MRTLKFITVSLTALVMLAGFVSAQQIAPLPVVVNTDPAGPQTDPSVVSAAGGTLLVAWQDSTVDDGIVRMQGFDRLGHRLGPVRAASTLPLGQMLEHHLATNVVGNSVLAWREDVNTIQRVVYRRLNLDGSPRSGVLPSSTFRLITGEQPATGIDSLGNVFLVWMSRANGEDSDIYGNFFPLADTVGLANQDTIVYGWAGDVQINEIDDGDQDRPALAVDSRGRALVLWRDLRPDSLGIFCRVYSQRGQPVGTFRLNASTPDNISALSAPAVSGAGLSFQISAFMAAWVETDTLGQNRLMRSRIDMQVLSFPPTVDVDTARIVRQRPGLEFATPAVDGDDDGNVTLAWTELEAGQGQVYGVMFNTADEILPPPIRLSSPEPGFGAPALNPAVSVGAEGSFVMVWQDTSGTDSDIRLQRYNAAGQVEQPLYSTPGSGDGENRSVAFLGRPDRGYEMYWENSSTQTPRILSVRYDYAGRPLSSPLAVSPVEASQRRPVSVSNGLGLQLLAWEEYSSGGYRVIAEIMREDGSGVRAPFAVASSSNSYLGSISAAFGAGGDAYLIWERWSQSSSAPDLMLARLDSLGAQQGSQTTVATASSGGGRTASAAVSPGGNLMVAWRQGQSPAANAHIRARVYSPSGSVLRNQIQVSRDTVEFIGSLGNPAVASSDSSGNFLVIWSEFFSNRNQLYYRLYSSEGDSIQFTGGQWRAPLGSSSGLADTDRAFGTPAAAEDSAGGFLVMWSESDPGGDAGLFGMRLDQYGAVQGAQFQVPGVKTAAMPVLSILESQRVAVAWQDTLGGEISFLSVQLHFHSLLGRVLLASSEAGGRMMVHAEGASVDSTELSADGSFRFENLLGGSYRVWVSADGSELPGTSSAILLSANDPPAVDIGVAADLRNAAPGLPRATSISLAQNSPNPFNPSTTVSFTVPEAVGSVHARLAVYDIRGARVRVLLERDVQPGTHRLEWDGRDSNGRRSASGVYFLRLTAGGESRVRKMVLIK